MGSSPVPSHRMSRVDHAWLRMDTEANLMMIVSVWLIRPQLSLRDLRERARRSLLAYPRFVQKVVEDATGATWLGDAQFDIAHHVVAETLRAAPGEAPLDALKRRVAALTVQPLDTARPLWQFHLIEDLDGARSALVMRAHHCIGDGIALTSVILSMADGGKPPPHAADAAHEAERDSMDEALIAPLLHAAIKAIEHTGKGIGTGLEVLKHRDGKLDIARVGIQAATDVAALALMPDDSPTRLKGIATPHKRVAWGEPLPLDEVKCAAKALGVTINDVLLACVAGAIGAYLRAKGDDPTGQEMRAMVPVNLRPLDQAYKLGNRFGLAPLVLPIGLTNPVQRLYTVHARMQALKHSYQPLLAFALLAVSGLMSKPLQSSLTGLFARKCSAVMTNVPGPRQRLALCGRSIEQIMFWVPQSGDIGIGVSILSYAGGVQFGLITDARMCPDPEAIVAGFAPEFDKLMWLALMAPWPAL